MRILVHEFASGGGLAGHDVPASLAREGSAMLAALVADLAAGGHEIVTTVDLRFPLPVPPGVEVVVLPAGGGATLDRLIATADAVWPIAPETNGCLERLAARVERGGTALLGPGSAAIRRASDKSRLWRRLARHGVAHPETHVPASGVDCRDVARQMGYPVVVKPGLGAGCEGVCLARDARELRRAAAIAHRANGTGPLVLQKYVDGAAASVSLLADGTRAVPLTVNAQAVNAARPFSYSGGCTPFDHPLAARAMETARRACEALPGLRGYVGVDLVLTDREAVVIEVNPRVTTAYLGVRAATAENVAALALAACAGRLPAPPRLLRRVRFSADGRIVSARPMAAVVAVVA